MATKTRARKKTRLQQTWFDWEQRPKFPLANRTRTSIAAAEAIADLGPTLRGKVFAFVAGQAAGATREEIAAALVMPLQTVCGRVAELLELQLIHRTGETRPTASGRAAAVVRAGRWSGEPATIDQMCARPGPRS